jgi:hypothetical protein
MPNTIPNNGFCIYLKRLRQEKRANISFSRTVGNYTCYLDSKAVAGLQGQMVERGGPGSNKSKNVRIKQGTYPLTVHVGPSYRTFKWKENHVLPALGLEGTDPRFGILIHPCHDDDHHYLSSIGCINPASSLTTAESGVNLQDSLDRTLAIIEAIQNAYNTLPKEGTIPNAVIIIEGEPA